jgi:DNA-binding XRE family transcriptional regulator
MKKQRNNSIIEKKKSSSFDDISDPDNPPDLPTFAHFKREYIYTISDILERGQDIVSSSTLFVNFSNTVRSPSSLIIDINKIIISGTSKLQIHSRKNNEFYLLSRLSRYLKKYTEELYFFALVVDREISNRADVTDKNKFSDSIFNEISSYFSDIENTRRFISCTSQRRLRYFVSLVEEAGSLYKEARPTAPQGLSENKEDKLGLIFERSLNRQALADALKHVREQKGLTQRAAAEAAHTSQTDIKRIENGTSSLDKAVDVLNELGFDLQIQLVPKNPHDQID